MTRSLLYLYIVISFLSCNRKAEVLSDWRGAGRDGIYSAENLLKVWPEDGPELLWSFESLGFGHSSVAVTNDRIYATGIKDTLTSTGTLFVFDLSGKLLWEKDYGPDFCLNFHGSRGTPVVAGELIYIESGMGAVYCLNTATGEKVWSVDFVKDLGVDSVIQFGYAESVLIDGDALVCVPGGKKNNVVKLNRFSGELIWASEGFGEPATYNAPILVNHGGRKLVIAMSASSIMGIDAETGEMFWRREQVQQNKIHANTPLYFDGKIVVSSAGRKQSGLVQLQLSDDGKSVSEVWRNEKFINLMGGIVRIDTCLYGSAYLKSDWQVISWNTGEMRVQNKELAGGNIIYADGMFYCYTERDGEIALVSASCDHFDVVSKFAVPLGNREHWAHPVISGGRLYVRHGNALMVYQIGE